jgi:hypothetical protein
MVPLREKIHDRCFASSLVSPTMVPLLQSNEDQCWAVAKVGGLSWRPLPSEVVEPFVSIRMDDQNQWPPLGGLNAQAIADDSSPLALGVAAADAAASHSRTQEKLSGSSAFSSCTGTSSRPESGLASGVSVSVTSSERVP